MSIEEVIPTGEFISMVDRGLSKVDHQGRRQLSGQELVELMLDTRKATERLQALSMTITHEVDQLRASDRAVGTPLTSTIANAEGLDDKAAAREVFGARDVTKHRKVYEATLAGEVSIDHARGISKGMQQLSPLLKPPQLERAEELFLERAKTSTPAELPKQADQVLALVAPDLALTPEDEAARLEAQRKRARAKRSFFYGDDGDGSTWFKGSLPHLEAEPLIQHIETHAARAKREARDAARAVRATRPGKRDLQAYGSSEEDATPAQRAADGLAALVHLVVSSGGETSHRADRSRTGRPAAGGERDALLRDPAVGAASPTSHTAHTGDTSIVEFANDHLRGDVADPTVGPVPGGGRPRIVVTIREADLRERAEQAGILASGAQIPPSELRRLCCDADLIPMVLGTDSQVLDYGRTVRLVPSQLREVLHQRDGGCIFPGCTTSTAGCEAHHVIPWGAGGVTSLHNLVLLCPHHHRVVEPNRFHPDADRWRIQFDPETGKPEVITPTAWETLQDHRARNHSLVEPERSEETSRLLALSVDSWAQQDPA